MYSIWAELASPLKADFKRLFHDYSRQVFDRDGQILTSYIPSEMGGSMPKSDYLTYMEDSELPQCYVTMSFGECSYKDFINKWLKTGVYCEPNIFGYFPEVMVIDLKRLGDRPVPYFYEDLCRPEYQGEICLIGSPKIPDPMLAYFIYKKLGKEDMILFIQNIGGFASPVDTIRHIGKSTNRFGSIFIMPTLFAAVCSDKMHAKVIIPKTGAIAEPFIYMKHKNAKDSEYIKEFLYSDGVRQLLEQNQFAFHDTENIPIDSMFHKGIYPEIEMIYQSMKEYIKIKR